MAIEIGNVNADTSVKLGTTTIQSGYIGYDYFYGKVFPVLDIFPTSVHHAYSLRKLRTAYTGACLRVRRTTTTPTVTTTTVDLAFDSNGTISLNSAITYVSGTATTAINLGQFCASVVNGYSNPDGVNTNQNIFVVTWFDQSGNGKNPTQGTAGNQPRLVSSTTADLERSGGKVAVRFVKTSTNFLTLNDNTANINNMSSYFVGAYVTTTGNGVGYSLSTVNRFYLPNTSAASGIAYAGYGASATAMLLETTTTNRRLYQLIAPTTGSTTLAQGWLNGVPKATVALVNGANANIVLGTAATVYYDGYIQEVIGWQTNANRAEKEININSYWTIY
jgi:hypothetical protein